MAPNSSPSLYPHPCFSLPVGGMYFPSPSYGLAMWLVFINEWKWSHARGLPEMRTYYKGHSNQVIMESESVSRSVASSSLQPHRLQTARLLCPWNSPGKNTGEGCYSLLQGIFPTQGSNPGFPHCRRILYCLSHRGISSHYGVGCNSQITHWVRRKKNPALDSRIYSALHTCGWHILGSNKLQIKNSVKKKKKQTKIQNVPKSKIWICRSLATVYGAFDWLYYVCLIAQSCPTLCNPTDCIACQAPLSMGFSKEEHWSRLPFPCSRNLPDPGIKPVSPMFPALQGDSLLLSQQSWVVLGIIINLDII